MNKKLICAGGILMILTGPLWAYAFSSYSGCAPNDLPYRAGDPMEVTTYGNVTSSDATLIAAGSPRVVQYIYVGGTGFGADTNGYINDPNADGSVRATDVQVNTVTYYVGDDLDSGNSFPSTAGKFFHGFTQSDAAQYAGVSPSASQFYVRVWNRAPADGDALFGDSQLFNPSVASNPDDPPPSPNDVGLANFIAQFRKAAPEPPNAGAASGIGSSPPQATLNWTSSLGGRWYSYQVATLEDTGYSAPVASGTVYNALRRTADINLITAKSVAVSLGTYGDNKNYRFRVRASNDFGNSDWDEGTPFFVPQTPDPYKPVAITDLTVTPEGTNLNLSWSAPYDKDRYGTVTICSLYDIRVSGEALVDTPTTPFDPGQTNPGNLSNWGAAQSIATYFSPAPTIPTPLAYGTRQTVTISNYPANTTLLFGIKSQDSTGNWSYISNIAGIGGGGGGGGWAADLGIAYNVSGQVVLTWRGSASTYDIYAAGTDGIFTLLSGGVAATTYTDTSAPAVRFYQVRPTGSQAGTRPVGKYTFNFIKQTGRTGINTFSIPFGSEIKGRNVASIACADDIINDIGVDKVEFVGRWNDTEQKSEGRVVYTTDPNNWHGPNFTLEQGKSYQISVGENVSWSIIGKK